MAWVLAPSCHGALVSLQALLRHSVAILHLLSARRDKLGRQWGVGSRTWRKETSRGEIPLRSQFRDFQAYRLALQASVDRLMRPPFLIHAVIASAGRWNIGVELDFLAKILLCPGLPSGTVIQAFESVT